MQARPGHATALLDSCPSAEGNQPITVDCKESPSLIQGTSRSLHVALAAHPLRSAGQRCRVWAAQRACPSFWSQCALCHSLCRWLSTRLRASTRLAEGEDRPAHSAFQLLPSLRATDPIRQGMPKSALHWWQATDVACLQPQALGPKPQPPAQLQVGRAAGCGRFIKPAPTPGVLLPIATADVAASMPAPEVEQVLIENRHIPCQQPERHAVVRTPDQTRTALCIKAPGNCRSSPPDPRPPLQVPPQVQLGSAAGCGRPSKWAPASGVGSSSGTASAGEAGSRGTATTAGPPSSRHRSVPASPERFCMTVLPLPDGPTDRLAAVASPQC